MTTIVAWPEASVPFLIKRESWREKRMLNRAEFKPQAGVAITRRRGTGRYFGSTAQVPATAAQLDLFWAWFEDELQDGDFFFTAPHPRTGLTKTWKIDGEPEEVPSGVKWIIVLTLVRID